jgi:hypothetical protein
MFGKSTLALTVVLVLSQPVQAQETFTIKLKSDTKGTSTHHLKDSTEAERIKVSDSANNVLDEKTKNTVLSEVFDQTVLERPDAKKKPTALKRTYTKATVKVEDDTEVLPYQGKTIVIEYKDGRYHFRYEGGAAIEGDDAKYLDKEFNKEQTDDDLNFETMLIPPKAVSVGEAWKVDVAGLLKALTKEGKMTADAEKSTGTGKLVKVYKKNGRQFGDLHYKIEVAVQAIMDKDSGNEIKLQPGAVLVVEVTMSACIDGSELGTKGTFAFNFDGTVILLVDGMDIHVLVSARHKGETTVSELGGKK